MPRISQGLTDKMDSSHLNLTGSLSLRKPTRSTMLANCISQVLWHLPAHDVSKIGLYVYSA